MPFGPGTRIGSYEVVGPLGAGGMGEVYRARDTKLERQVALKILPEAFTGDADRLARFEREAKVLASLNHPNIGHIYGIEEADGQKALVLELVDGPTLDDRVARGPIPLDEALPIATQIAEALEAAHERGIVHRDLKPANVKVRPDGTVKVLDFGLAKAFGTEQVDADASQSPTLSARATQAGVILGTAAYMAPEQARGKPVDKRADIWAFGALLYETLCGTRAFTGQDVGETLAAVIRGDPEWSKLPGGVPRRLREVLKRCLEKDLRQRYRDMGDVGLDLEGVLEGPDGGTPSVAGRGVRTTLVWVATALALGAALTGTALRGLTPREPRPPRPVRFSFEVPGASLRVMRGFQGRLAMSPDGRILAYLGPRDEEVDAAAPGSNRQLYLRRMDEPEGRVVPGTAGAQSPFFSPDGEWVGFVARGKLLRVPVNGGAPLEICRTGPFVFGASWGSNGRIVFGGGIGSGLMGVAVTGGDPEPLTSPDGSRGEVVHGYPDVLPDGRSLLFAVGTGGGSRLARLSLETGDREEILPEGANPRYLSGGRLLFSHEDTLRVTGFDVDQGAVKGPVLPVADGIRWESGAGLAEAYFTASRNGDLAFVPEGPLPETRPVWVDRSGAESEIAVGRGFYFEGRPSPDGRRLAMSRAGEELVGEIWLTKADGSQGVPIADEGADYNPCWTPDGTRLTFTSNGNLFEMDVDREHSRAMLLARENYQFPQSWSRDGRTLTYMEVSPGGMRLWVMPRDGTPDPLLDSSFNSGSGRFSPRDDWIAYVSDQSGRREVYVRPYPDSGRGLMVSRGGGRQPVWSADGRELFFRRGNRMLAVEIAAQPELAVGEPVTLWEAPYYSQEGLWANYDVAPDGRFLMIKRSDVSDTEPDRIHVHLDWLAQVEQEGTNR